MKFLSGSVGLLLYSVASAATISFPVTLTWAKGSPDGFEREMVLVNGQFPGPTLKINQGDNVEFTVNNQLPYDTTVHFHGIDQISTPWSDGVPGVTQEKIPKGSKFKYKWTATNYGTYWYHGHVQGQLEDGLFGAIHINPPTGISTPFSQISKSAKDLQQLDKAMRSPQVAIVSDWSHFTSEDITNIYTKANIDFICLDSILINGKGNVNCPGVPFLMSLVPPSVKPILAGKNLTDKGCVPLSNVPFQTNYPHDLSAVPYGLQEGCNVSSANPYVFQVDPSQGWASFNVISTSSVTTMMFSIDEHPLWVYAVDGRLIQPQIVDAMILQHGSRHSVMVQLNKPKKDYSVRVASAGLNQKLFVSGVLSYRGGNYPGGSHTNVTSIPYIDYGAANTTANVTFLDDSTIVPFPAVKPAQHADQTVKLLLNRTGAAYQWTLSNDMPYNISLEDIEPLLYNPHQLDNTSLVFSTKNGTWVDIIFIATISGGIQPPHPIHKHSNKAHIIGSGVGEFTWADAAAAMKDVPGSFNLNNPPYRDGFYTLPVVQASTWMVVRYQVINPGPFIMHCHINPHFTGGMGVVILDGISTWPKVPKEYGPGGSGF